jgi:hypothetical protein
LKPGAIALTDTGAEPRNPGLKKLPRMGIYPHIRHRGKARLSRNLRVLQRFAVAPFFMPGYPVEGFTTHDPNP